MPWAAAMLLAILGVGAARAAPRWETLPPMPTPVAGEKTGYADVDSIKLYYATIGQGRRS